LGFFLCSFQFMDSGIFCLLEDKKAFFVFQRRSVYGKRKEKKEEEKKHGRRIRWEAKGM